MEVHQEIHPSSLPDWTPYPTNHPYLHYPRHTKQQDHEPRIHTKNHRYRPDQQLVVPEFQSGQLSPQSHPPCQKLIPKYSMTQLEHPTHTHRLMFFKQNVIFEIQKYMISYPVTLKGTRPIVLIGWKNPVPFGIGTLMKVYNTTISGLNFLNGD